MAITGTRKRLDRKNVLERQPHLISRPPPQPQFVGADTPLPGNEHARSTQQGRRVLDQHRQRSHRPRRDGVVGLPPTPKSTGSRAHSSARATTLRAFSTFAAWIRRSITAAFRPTDSIRSTEARGSATASTRPGKPAPAPTSAMRRALASEGTSKPERLSATCTSRARSGSLTVVWGSGSAASASSSSSICGSVSRETEPCAPGRAGRFRPADPGTPGRAECLPRGTLRARGRPAPG